MKKRAVFLLLLIFLIGAGIGLYPLLGNWWNQRHQGVVINDYDDLIADTDQEQLLAQKKAAQDYNAGLIDQVILTDPFDPNETTKNADTYLALLNPNGNGAMGYLQIPKIDVKLAIYHGTGAEVLASGVGHLENTSLPVGGKATHAVLSAHTGYPTAKYFDNLIKLEEGDLFYLTVLDEVLAYRVDQIKVVLPADTTDLRIDKENDYVTLVTCTPYGVNSHRLLVRGVRVPYQESDLQLSEQTIDITWYLIAGIAVLALVVPVTYKIYKRKKSKVNAYETNHKL